MLESLFGQDEDSYEHNGDASENHAYKSLFRTQKLLKPPEKRCDVGFVGLENQGATCYLNSLIQALYMTAEFRGSLFSIDPISLGVLNLDPSKIKDDGGVTDLEPATSAGKPELSKFEPTGSLLQFLISMGVPPDRAVKTLFATHNNTDLNVLLEYLDAHDTDIDQQSLPTGWNAGDMNALTADAGLDHEPDTGDVPGGTESCIGSSIATSTATNFSKKKRKPRMIPLELQKLFTQMMCLDKSAVSTKALTENGFEWRGMDGQVQHDAHELNRLLIDAIEQSLKRTKGENVCQQLYAGELVNSIKCKGCSGLSERRESFYDINLQIIGSNDIVESLRSHCAAELLDGDSAYHCDRCGGKQAALRSSVLRAIPPVLTFSCNRFRIDASTNWNRQKVTSCCSFPLLLDMEVFQEGYPSVNDAIFTDAKEESEYKASLRSRMVWLEDSLELAKKWGLRLSEKYGSEFKDVTYLPSEELREICKELNTPSKRCEHQGRQLYRLHAVVVHTGSAHAGHYFAYIRDSLREGVPVPVYSYSNNSNDGDDDGKNSSNISVSTTDLRHEVCVRDAEKGPKDKKSGDKPSAMFCKDAQSGDVYISSISPLGVLVAAVKAGAPVPVLKGSGRNKQASAVQRNDRSVYMKDVFTEVSKVLNFIQGEAGSWSKTFKARYGTIEKFVQQPEFEGLLSTSGDSMSLSVTLHKCLSVHVVSPSEVIRLRKIQAFRIQTSDTARNTGGDLVEQLSAFDEDEACAQALQLSLSVDDGNTSYVGDNADKNTIDDNWTVVDKKKLKQSVVPEPGTKLLSSTHDEDHHHQQQQQQEEEDSNPSSTEHQTVDASVKPAVGYAELLAEQLLSHAHGNFFEFNDTQVTALPLSRLKDSFKGTASAYILVYRRVDLDDNREEGHLKQVSPDSDNAKGHFQAMASAARSPPEYWRAAIAEENAHIAAQREAYTKNSHAIRLRLLFPCHLEYRSPLFHFSSSAPAVVPIDTTTHFNDRSVDCFVDNFSIISYLKDGQDDAKNKRKGILIEIDGRATASQLLERIRHCFSDEQLITLGILPISDIIESKPALVTSTVQNMSKYSSRKTKGSKQLLRKGSTSPTHEVSAVAQEKIRNNHKMPQLCLTMLNRYGDFDDTINGARTEAAATAAAATTSKRSCGLHASRTLSLNSILGEDAVSTSGGVIDCSGELLIWDGHSIPSTQVRHILPEAEVAAALAAVGSQKSPTPQDASTDIAVGFATLPKELNVKFLGQESKGSDDFALTAESSENRTVDNTTHTQVLTVRVGDRKSIAQPKAIIVQKSIDPFFSPYCMTLTELCSELIDTFGLTSSTACIHFQREEQLKPSSGTKDSRSGHETVASVMFDHGFVLDRVFRFTENRYNTGTSTGNRKMAGGSTAHKTINEDDDTNIIMSMHGSTLIGELPAITHILVEDRTLRGLKQDSKSLAEQYCSSLGTEWQINIEVDCRLDHIFGQLSNDTGADVSAQSLTLLPTLLRVVVKKYVSVIDMKSTIVSKLLDVYDDIVRQAAISAGKSVTNEEHAKENINRRELASQLVQLRAGIEKGVRVLDDESVSLECAVSGTYDGMSLYLEQAPSRKLAPGFIDVTIALVVNNSWKFDYEKSISAAGKNRGSRKELESHSILDQKLGGVSSSNMGGEANSSIITIPAQGERLHEVCVTVSETDTILSLRDKAGVLLLGLDSGWTATEMSNQTPELDDADTKDNCTTAPACVPTLTKDVNCCCDDVVVTIPAEEKKKSVPRRLRRTSWLQEPAALLLEQVDAHDDTYGAAVHHKKKADNAASSGLVMATVHSSALRSGDTLLLEEGPLPVKGQVTFEIFVWNDTVSSISVEVDVDSDSVVPSPPQMEPSTYRKSGCDEDLLAIKDLESLNTFTEIRKRCLVSIGSVTTVEDRTLASLQEDVFSLVWEAREALKQAIGGYIEPKDMDHMLLRELRLDFLPGRSFWTCDIPSSQPSGGGMSGLISQIGTKGGGAASLGSTGVSGSAANSTLRRLNLRGSKPLVVELLPNSQKVMRPPCGAFRVWAQQLMNPGEAAEGYAVMHPAWPPRQVLINGGSAPTMGHLKRAFSSAFDNFSMRGPTCSTIADALSGKSAASAPCAAASFAQAAAPKENSLSVDNIVVYKYQPHSFVWSELRSASDAAAAGSAASSSYGRKKKTSAGNICQAPYFVKEGDQFCTFLVSSPDKKDQDISLLEDVVLRRIKEREKLLRSQRKKKSDNCTGLFAIGHDRNPKHGSSGGKQRQEIILSLGRGFEFSDDEEEAEK